MSNSKIISDLIAHFGSQTKLANAIGVKQGAVTGWLNGKFGISESNALKIEIATDGKFRAIDLCPALAEIEQLKQKSANQQVQDDQTTTA